MGEGQGLNGIWDGERATLSAAVLSVLAMRRWTGGESGVFVKRVEVCSGLTGAGCWLGDDGAGWVPLGYGFQRFLGVCAVVR